MPKYLILLIFLALPATASDLVPFGQLKQSFGVSGTTYSSKFNDTGKVEALSAKVQIKPKFKTGFLSTQDNQLGITFLYELEETKYNANFFYGLLPNLTVGVELAMFEQRLKVTQKINSGTLESLSTKEKVVLKKASAKAAKATLSGEYKKFPSNTEEMSFGDVRVKGIYNPLWGGDSLKLLGEITLPSGKLNNNYELMQTSVGGEFSVGLGFVLSPAIFGKIKTEFKLMSKINFDQSTNLSVYDKIEYLGEDHNVIVNQGIENQIGFEVSRNIFSELNLLAGVSYFKRSGAKLEGSKFGSKFYQEYLDNLYASFQSYSVGLSKAFDLYNNKAAVNLKYQNVFNGINIYKAQITRLGVSYFY